tara:strand:+ start:118 stop:372 length:255 start_codon:yes stop_codon:yes gene_type:complete
MTMRSSCAVFEPLASEPAAITVVWQLPVAVPFTLTLRVEVADEPCVRVKVVELRFDQYPSQVLSWVAVRVTVRSSLPSFSIVMV